MDRSKPHRILKVIITYNRGVGYYTLHNESVK